MRAVPPYLLRPVRIEGRPDERLDLEERVRHYRVPGIALAVVQQGAITASEAHGDSSQEEPGTPRSLFQAGSISKPVTAVGALRLVEQGHLELDADVNQQLRTWKIPPHRFRGQVTLRRLLAHSAGTSVTGFPGYPTDSTTPTTRQILNGQAPANTGAVRVIEEPGTNVHYSGGGFIVVQQLIEDTTGLPFSDAMTELVLEPAGMNNSTFELDPDKGAMNPLSSGHLPNGSEIPGGHHIYPEQAAAGLWTTATDLAHFSTALTTSLTGSGKLLPKDLATEMLSPHADIYGLGIRIDQSSGKDVFWHTGATAGFRAHLRFSTDGHGVVALANGDDAMALINEVFEGQYARLGRLAPERRTVRVADLDTAAYAGHYEYRFEEFQHALTLTATNCAIAAVAPTLWHSIRQWLPEGRHRFTAPDGGTPIRFHFDSTHQVESLDWGSYRFRKSSG